MSRLIRFYFRETKNFAVILIGFYILFNIIGIFSRGTGFLPFWSFVVQPLIMLIYLIKFNLSDTGKDTFTPVSMTASSPAEILLAKLIVSYTLILMTVIIECIFVVVCEISLHGRIITLWESLVMFPMWSLFVTTLAIGYISYFTIWGKSFAVNKIWRRVIVVGAVVIWFIMNGIIRSNVVIFSTDTISSGRHFGGDRLGIWSVIWHLTWCAVFFLVTAYLQKKKIDQI